MRRTVVSVRRQRQMIWLMSSSKVMYEKKSVYVLLNMLPPAVCTCQRVSLGPSKVSQIPPTLPRPFPLPCLGNPFLQAITFHHALHILLPPPSCPPNYLSHY